MPSSSINDKFGGGAKEMEKRIDVKAASLEWSKINEKPSMISEN